MGALGRVGRACLRVDRPVLFFSVDVYTCKLFDVEQAVDYTDRFFSARRIAAKAF